MLIDIPIPRQIFVSGQDNILKTVVFLPEIVGHKLLHLKPGKAPGVDLVHSRVLKETADQLCLPLAEMFNSSLRSAVVLDEWRYANVVPVYKKGDRSFPGNYRPVSLTSQVCKVMESIIRD